MRFKSIYGHLAAALTGVAAFHFAWREVTYKVADCVMVHADAAGFAEMAGERPWGAVDWLASMLAATNLEWWGILVQLALVAAASMLAYFALRHRGSKLSPFAPWLAAAVFILPTLALGEDVWKLRHPQFAQMHLAWFMVLAGCLFAGWKGLAAFVAIPFALVAVGKWFYYDLPADEVLWSAWNLPMVQEWDGAALGVVGIYILTILLAFVGRGRRRRADPTEVRPLPMWGHLLAPVLFAGACFVAWPERDTRDQLRMEYAVRDSRFAEVLKIAPDKKSPWRMESAWRILAMYRTDRLDWDLFRYPVSESHNETREQEMLMGGPLLLFHYGLVLPARRWVFEVASVNGWHPQDFRMMGDIAIMTGEGELARKNFEELLRCPFRGGYAAKMLRLLSMSELPDGALAHLDDIAEMGVTWRKLSESSTINRYADFNCNGEQMVYELFERLKLSSPKMFKMVLASALLNGHPERVRENAEALRQLCPDGNIGPVFLSVFR